MRLKLLAVFILILSGLGFSQSASFKTYMNPVIPGDHPDCTLTKIGNYFYTTGSSFGTSPIIYRSTDLVHWEPISHPVSNSWEGFKGTPTDGCWGGDMVYYENKYWDFFGHASKMYFVKADKPEGPWTKPVEMKCPKEVPGLGMDNSIFIDDSTWYLLVKNGQPNNWIVQLGPDGQPAYRTGSPAGKIYNLTWINPAPKFPFSWAEGPVMWKYNGYYYYCFAINVYSGQRIFRSRTLTSDSSSWENLGDFFNIDSTKKYDTMFPSPNHCSAAVELNDGTWWVLTPAYSTTEWVGQGRQGLLDQVHYNSSGKPVAMLPLNEPMTAPKLPSSGIPWMVPKSDFFNSKTLSPQWSLLGYSPVLPYSLTKREGWIYIKPVNEQNTITQNDAEHNYSLITKVDFNPVSSKDEAGLRIMTGLRNLYAKLYSTFTDGKKIICFSFDSTSYTTPNTIGDTLWFRIIRVNHNLSGYYSANGFNWTQIGNTINVSRMDIQQPDYNAWTGNRQGLYVQGAPAYFDLYIYRDAYSPILAECPANQFGTSHNINSTSVNPLEDINNNDWAMYAGVEFGGKDYPKVPDSIKVVASSAAAGGTVQVWLDSLDTGEEIAECNINNTGSWNTYKTFSAAVKPVQGRHDVYVKFLGKGKENLFRLKWLSFTAKPSSEIGN